MLHNPSGIYQGQAVLNPQPYVNIALQARARKQAREDAIDKHFQDLPNTINDKGVRDQEIEGLNTMKNDIYAFGQQNKEALRNPKLDNGAAQFALQKKFRDASTYAQNSKNRVFGLTKIQPYLINPKYSYLKKDPKFMEALAANELPVGVEGSQALDVNTLLMPPEPWANKATKYFEGFKDIKQDEEITYRDGADKLSRIEVKTPKLSEVSKIAIAQRASDNLIDNPAFEEHIKNQMESNPDLLPQLQKTFKDNFGRDINPMLADHDIAVAYTLLGMGNTGVKEKTVPNATAIKDRQEKFQVFMEGLKQKNRKELIGVREEAKAKGEAANDLWVEAYIDKLGEDAAKSPGVKYKYKSGEEVQEHDIPLDALLSKVLSKDGISPDALRVTNDGRYRPIFFKRDAKTGVPLKGTGGYAVDEISSVPISKSQLKFVLGAKAGTKQLNKEMSNKDTYDDL